MNKIFILTEGAYSDYHIVGVFSDYAVAEEYKTKLGADSIEEWYLDAFPDSLYGKEYLPYSVCFSDQTRVIEYTYDINGIVLHKNIFADRHGRMWIGLLAKDASYALKIASDIRRQLIADDIVANFFRDNPDKRFFTLKLDYDETDYKPEVGE